MDPQLSWPERHPYLLLGGCLILLLALILGLVFGLKKSGPTCPELRSSLIIVQKNETLSVGTHKIDRTGYDLRVFAPLTVVAAGPTGHTETHVFSEPCGETSLVLKAEHNYDTLILSLPTTTNKCPGFASTAIITSSVDSTQKTLGLGEHPISRTDYVLKVFAPLTVVATGPTGHTETRVFIENYETPCGEIRFELDEEHTYDKLTLSIPNTSNKGLAFIEDTTGRERLTPE
jgi:hypothetical protein